MAAVRNTIVSIVLSVQKTIKKMASLLSTLVIITALIVAALYIAGIKPYVVTTGSMEPSIHVHSICFVNSNVQLEDISVGDVITFSIENNVYVTHRVISIFNGKYKTKGDAADKSDSSYVTRKNYVGKVNFVIPKIGFIIYIMHSRKGKIVISALAIIFIAVSFFTRNKDKQDESSPDDNKN